jgi:hypothetical protein
MFWKAIGNKFEHLKLLWNCVALAEGFYLILNEQRKYCLV